MSTMPVRSGVMVRRRPPTPSAVYDTYWNFAVRRQDIFHRRVRGEPAPWTTDPVISVHRFTNAYRASDRVSQYLIRQVAYEGDQATEEVAFRVLLFKLFNRIGTWELLSDALGPLRADSFDVDRFDEVLSAAFERGERLYSAAYIMPAASRSSRRKHRTHLELLRTILQESLPQRLTCNGIDGRGVPAAPQLRGHRSLPRLPARHRPQLQRRPRLLRDGVRHGGSGRPQRTAQMLRRSG